MAQTFTAASLGTGANTGDGNPFRTGGLKIVADLTELYGLVASLSAAIITEEDILRGDKDLSYISGVYNVVFDSEFVSDYTIFITTNNGMGYSISNQSSTGFDIEFLDACTFGFVCLKNTEA